MITNRVKVTVSLAHAVAQALRHLLQQQVALFVAERVVDGQVIEVDEQQRPRSGCGCWRQRPLQAVEQQRGQHKWVSGS